MHEYHKLTVQWCKVDSETPWENTTLGGGGGYKMITVQWSKAPWENTTLGREGGGVQNDHVLEQKCCVITFIIILRKL